jgi:apolipoprotein N-acyltransferase
MTPAMRWLRPAALAALGSLLACLAVAPIGWWPCALVAWAPLTLVAREAAAARRKGDRHAVRRAVMLAFAVALGRWLWLEQWIAQVSDAGLPALAGSMALFDGLFVWAVARTETMPSRARWPLALRSAILLTACEWFRGRVFLEGYPWFLPAQPLIEWLPLAQAADLVGAAGLAVVPGAIAGALAEAWPGSGAAPVPWKRSVALATCLLGACVSYGWARLAEAPAQASRVLQLLVVQPSVPQSNKDSPDRRRQDAQVAFLLETTQAAMEAERAAGRHVDLIVWPETVVPGVGLERDAILLQRERGLWPGDRYVAPIEALAARGTPILLGSAAYIGLGIQGDRYVWKRQFNSGYLLRGPGDFDRVDKILLTPFGETMPYISNWKWLEERLLDIGARGMRFDLQAGDTPGLLQVRAACGTVRLGVPICFEDTVSRATRAIAGAGEGAEALVNLSNDGWFGPFDAGRVHHEQAARWRAVELRRPLVRVANTGLTAAFDHLGRRVAGPLGARTEGTLRVDLPLDGGWSIFARVGDVASWSMFLAGIAMVVGRAPRAPAAASALLLGLVMACDTPRGDRLPTWSSKDQSVMPEGEAGLNGKPVNATLPVPASGDMRSNALRLLDEASRSQSPLLRAISMEALEHDPTTLEPAVRRGLGDANPGVRFVAAMVGSKARLPGLATLVEPLLLDANDSVKAAAILALHRAGRSVDPSPLIRMIVAPTADVRGNAAMVLGEMGNRSALPMLADALGAPMPKALPAQVRVVDLQIGEAMVKLGDRSQLEPIHAALFSRSDQGECIGLACQIVGSLRDQTALPMLQRLIDANGLDTRPAEIRLVAAVAVMHIAPSAPATLAELGQLGARDTRAEVRGIAAKLLGFFRSPEVDVSLGRLLRDRDPVVQVAAAAAILRRESAGATPAQR